MEYRPRLSKEEYQLILDHRGVNKEPHFKSSNLPKILLFDIETAPLIAEMWSPWGDAIRVLRDSNIICWSAKWLLDDKMYNASLKKKEIIKGDDERITRSLWQLFDEADILIAHNLNKFDKKVAQTRFFKYDLKMPSHYQKIDTLVTLKKEFKITYNRLDYVARNFLGYKGKLQTEKYLWHSVTGDIVNDIKPDMDAMQRMQDYCDQDVRVLEDVYMRLRPYITNHPNLALWIGSDERICKACGNNHFTQINDYTTLVNVYEAFRCNNCGSVHRSRKPIKNSNISLR